MSENSYSTGDQLGVSHTMPNIQVFTLCQMQRYSQFPKQYRCSLTARWRATGSVLYNARCSLTARWRATGSVYTMPGAPWLPGGELLGVSTAPGTGSTTGEALWSPARAPLHCNAPIYCTECAPLHCSAPIYCTECAPLHC